MKSDKASFTKTIDVIRSCQTDEQLDIAKKYVELACRRGDKNYFIYYSELSKRSVDLNNSKYYSELSKRSVDLI